MASSRDGTRNNAFGESRALFTFNTGVISTHLQTENSLGSFGGDRVLRTAYWSLSSEMLFLQDITENYSYGSVFSY